MQRWRRIRNLLAGFIAALITAELALRAFATPGIPPVPRITSDSFAAPVIVRRQIEEGVATSHFSDAGARLTGTTPTRSGLTAIVLGDSYVVAEQVKDDRTMGAGLERLARGNGIPLDVRQYGWSGASPAQYLYVAPAIRSHWKPRRVFIALSDNDFDHHALLLASPRIRVDSTLSTRIIGAPIDTARPPAHRSVLLMLAAHRWSVLNSRFAKWSSPRQHGALAAAVELPPDSAEYARTPEAVVNALSASYGDALTLVYIATVGTGGDTTPAVIERQFLDACYRLEVDCASTRAAMLEALRSGRVSHGVGNIALGIGHLNVTGHDVVARVMWHQFQFAPHEIATRSREEFRPRGRSAISRRTSPSPAPR